MSDSQQQQGAAGAAVPQGLAGQQRSPTPEDVDEGLDEDLLLEYEEAANEVAAAAGSVDAAAVADEGLEGREGGEDEGEGVDEGGEEEVDFDQPAGLLSQGYLVSQEHYLEPASDDGFDAEDF